MSVNVLRFLYFVLFNPHNNLQGSNSYYPHDMEAETEAQSS